MAIAGQAFSPKEYTVWIISDATNAGTTGAHASNMYQLDVDSVGFPSLNVNQAVDIKSGAGRVLKDEDFFQDNVLRVVEVSLSGTMHNDAGHELLMQNICNSVAADPIIATSHSGASQRYGEAVANAASSLTIGIKASDHTNQKSLELPGMVVTNFVLSGDSATEGGRYKFSATLQSGSAPDLAEVAIDMGTNEYANSTAPVMSDASAIKVFNTEVVMNSFSVTIDHPAVFAGAKSTGYEIVARGAECAVTVDTQVKYDGNTKGFLSAFDGQSSYLAGNMFVVVNNNAYGVSIPNGVLTNVAYAEGDVLMLDCSIKAVDAGATVLTFDGSA